MTTDDDFWTANDDRNDDWMTTIAKRMTTI